MLVHQRVIFVNISCLKYRMQVTGYVFRILWFLKPVETPVFFYPWLPQESYSADLLQRVDDAAQHFIYLHRCHGLRLRGFSSFPWSRFIVCHGFHGANKCHTSAQAWQNRSTGFQSAKTYDFADSGYNRYYIWYIYIYDIIYGIHIYICIYIHILYIISYMII